MDTKPSPEIKVLDARTLTNADLAEIQNGGWTLNPPGIIVLIRSVPAPVTPAPEGEDPTVIVPEGAAR